MIYKRLSFTILAERRILTYIFEGRADHRSIHDALSYEGNICNFADNLFRIKAALDHSKHIACSSIQHNMTGLSGF